MKKIFKILFFCISLMAIIFYFWYFNKDLLELKELSDDIFVTKYQNADVKDADNMYYYLTLLSDEKYKDNRTLFWKNKQILVRLEKSEDFIKNKDSYENIFICYIVDQKEPDKCGWMDLKNYKNSLTQTGTFLEETITKTNIIKLINENNIFKRTNNWAMVLYSILNLRTSSYFLIQNIDDWNNQSNIDYFNQYYSFYNKILHWDGNEIDYAVAISSINILNNQLSYIMDNSHFSKWELSTLEKILHDNFGNYNPEDTYDNMVKNEYFNQKNIIKIAQWTNNYKTSFVYDIPRTILTLKNLYYYWGLKRDEEFLKNFEVKRKDLISLVKGKSDDSLVFLMRRNMIWNTLISTSYIDFHYLFSNFEKLKTNTVALIVRLQKLGS